MSYSCCISNYLSWAAGEQLDTNRKKGGKGLKLEFRLDIRKKPLHWKSCQELEEAPKRSGRVTITGNILKMSPCLPSWRDLAGMVVLGQRLGFVIWEFGVFLVFLFIFFFPSLNFLWLDKRSSQFLNQKNLVKKSIFTDRPDNSSPLMCYSLAMPAQGVWDEG